MQGALPSVSAVLRSEGPLLLLCMVPGMTCPRLSMQRLCKRSHAERVCVCAQSSFLGIAYPVLILTYLGQAAWLTQFPDQVSSTFYASIPYGDGSY